MMHPQIAALFGVFTHPRRTMQEMPSDRLYALAILAPIYFNTARAFRPRNYALLQNAFGGNVQIILFVLAFTILMLPVGGWLVQQILRLFRKKLSVMKILNISGYSHVPRIIIAILGYALLCADPSILETDRLSSPLIALIGLGFVGIVYTLFLTIFGIVVSPSDGTPRAN